MKLIADTQRTFNILLVKLCQVSHDQSFAIL